MNKSTINTFAAGAGTIAGGSLIAGAVATSNNNTKQAHMFFQAAAQSLTVALCAVAIGSIFNK